MKKLLTLSVMFILCLLTFATDFMRVKFIDGNIVKYEVDNIEEVDFEIGKDTTAIGDTTAIDTSNTPLKFRITSGSTAEVIHGNLYANIDAISIPEKVSIGGKIYSVTSIGSSAFENCSSLTSINIPEGVTSIDSASFVGCSSLASIQIPNSVTSIGDFAFYGCSGLTSVKISEKVRRIGNSAFSGCNGLTSIQIPESVKEIDELAFYRCINLDVAIDNFEGNVALGFGAFEGCKSVTYLKNNDITAIDTSDTPLKFSITSDSTAEVIGGRGNYSNLDSISIPAKVRIGDKIYNVTSIGIYAFEEWYWLKSIQIPNSVTGIGDFAFYGCSSLTSIKIPEGVTSIGDQAFEGCRSLTSIKIPESVTSIGIHAFDRCDNLEPKLLIYDNGTKCYGWIGDKEKCTNVVIPEGVSCIGTGAFYFCRSLTSIQIPESVTSIGERAFEYCDSLEAKLLIYDNGTKCYGWIGDKEKCKNVVIPEGVTSIGYGAFNECSWLKSIQIPNSVTSIGDHAFFECGLKSINIPESVTSIGDWAFAGCHMTSIQIPESVTSIGNWAFMNCCYTDIIIDNFKDNVKVGGDAFKNCKSVTWLRE